MKSWGTVVQQVLFSCALIAFGILCGLAFAILFEKMNLEGIAPLFGTAMGSLIGSTVAVAGALYVARLNERRSQLTALDQALYPIDEFMQQVMGLSNLVNRRMHPEWDRHHGQTQLARNLRHLHQLFEKIAPVPGLPPGLGQTVQVNKLMWTLLVEALGDAIGPVGDPNATDPQPAVDHAMKIATELIRNVATFTLTVRNKYEQK